MISFHRRSHKVFTPSIVSVESNYPSSVGKSVVQLEIPSMADTEGAIGIFDAEGHEIDWMSYNDGMHSSILRDKEGVSLERVSATVSSDDLSNWHSASATSGYATPGNVNSSSRDAIFLDDESVEVVPEIIDRTRSMFAQIFYQFESAGLVANVSVIDIDGRPIRHIASNQTLGRSGFFSWDGERDDGQNAPVGYYLVWFQVFDTEGWVRTYRHRVVVGF